MMFDAAFQIMMSILTVAAFLSLFAIAVSWITRKRRPALEHACWVIVLLRFVTTRSTIHSSRVSQVVSIDTDRQRGVRQLQRRNSVPPTIR